MGLNTHMKSTIQSGYNSEATATAIINNIDPYEGFRIAITGFGATCSSTAGDLTFMNVLGRTAVAADTASGIYTVVFDGDPGVVSPANLFASGDFVCVELDDGTFQFSYATNWWVSNHCCVLAEVLKDTVADGNKVWNFGIYTDEGHMGVALTINAQTKLETTGYGLFFGASKGDPIMVHHLNNSSQVGAIDWITGAYINS